MPRGGYRPGAGRKPKPKAELDLRRTPEEKRTLAELCKPLCERMVAVLRAIAENPRASPAARVLAADKILDRAYGRPSQEVRGSGAQIVIVTDLALRRPLPDQTVQETGDAYTISLPSPDD